MRSACHCGILGRLSIGRRRDRHETDLLEFIQGMGGIYEKQHAVESPAISHTGGQWRRCLGLGPLATHGSVGTGAGGPRE